MPRKRKHGGPRPGPGRKRKPYNRKMRVYAFCEELQCKAREQKRWERVEARPDTEAKRRHQADWQGAMQWVVRLRQPTTLAGESRRVTSSRRAGAAAAELDKLGRIGSAPETPRPKNIRDKILKLAAEKFGISIDVADKWWKFGRKEARKMRHRLSSYKPDPSNAWPSDET